MNGTPTRPRRPFLGFAAPTFAIAVIHAAIATFFNAELNVWIDECYTWDTISGTVERTWRQALELESQPPGYFIILNLWNRLMGTVFFARTLSTILTTLTIFMCDRISRSYFGNLVSPSLLPLLVATQPLTLFAAVEMRRYALVLFLTALLILVFKRAFDWSTGVTWRWKIVYFVVASSLLYVDYFAVLLVAAHGVVLAAHRGWRNLVVLAVIGAAITILGAPVLLSTPAHIDTYEAIEGSSTTQVFKTMRFIWYSMDTLVMTHWLHPWNRPIKMMMFVGAAYLLLIAIVKNRKSTSPIPVMDPLILTLTIGLGFVGVSLVAAPAILQPKHLTVILIPGAMVASGVWTLLRPVAAFALLCGILTVNLLASVHEFRPLAKRGDSIRVARWVEQHERRNEPIVVFYPEVSLGFEHHYAGVNRVVPIPGPADFETYDLTQYVLPDHGEFWSSLESEITGASHIWVVTDAFSDPEIGGCGFGELDFNCDRFERWLSDTFTLKDDARFFKSRVRYYERTGS